MDLSVIIPCHNEAATLPDQLDALTLQTWSGEWEVIVVNNGSDDGTGDLARTHPLSATRLRVIEAHDGRGAAYARRAGVDASTGRTLGFVDGDDVVAPGWLAAMGDALREHPLVTGGIDLEQLNEPSVALSRGDRSPDLPPMYAAIVFLRGNNCGMWRTVWDDLGGFDDRFGALEDIELALRAAAVGLTVHYEPAALVQYRYRTDWRSLWKQGVYYGRSEPVLRRRCRELRLAPPTRGRSLRSWAWLVLFAPRLRHPAVRSRWLWTLAVRTGALRGMAIEALRRR